MTRRRLPTLLLSLIAATGLLGIPVGPTAPVEVRAATPDLTIVSSARYDVQPASKRVRVTVDLTLHNRLKDTTTRRYYFDHAFLDVLPRASAIKLTTGGKAASVRVVRKSNAYTRLRLNLASRLFSGKSVKYRLTFNVTDPGGAATRDLRIGDSLVSFPVWSFATESTPGSSVTVVFPEGYDVRVEAGKIPAGTKDGAGRTIFRSGRLDKPLDFFAYLVADRPGAYVDATVSTSVLGAPVDVNVRSWKDDAPWAKRVGDLLKVGLPALGERIGLGWPEYPQPLTVQEAVSRTTGGYAGRFDPAAGKVEIAYYADDFVVLHEAAHAWFNGSLLADRWANEAFASYYAAAAAADLERKVRVEALTDELRRSKIPLNGWGPVGSEDVAQEDYAYAASLVLAKEIAKRANREGLIAVWTASQAGVGAYQPARGAAETVEAPPDWRGLLDLLEEQTEASYDDLWREWVARDTDLPLLDARAEARTQYETLVTTAGDWNLPLPIRDALRAWRFSDATTLLSDAEAALAGREAVMDAAQDAGLTAPANLRLAFEDDDGFADSAAETTAELDVIGRYAAAEALRPGETTPFMTLGLWGQTPDADLVESRAAFTAGDLQASAAASEDAARTWSNAESLGQSRAVSIGLIVLSVLFGLALIIAGIRRRRRRHVTMQARRLRG